MRFQYQLSVAKKLRGLSLSAGLLTASTLVGCGGSGTPTAEKPASDQGQSQTVASSTGNNDPTPETVVSLFLDGVRRGGAGAEVGKLMTQKAQEQYEAVGLVMQPIGAPDAEFQVTRSVPYGEQGVLVNSLWTEKTPEGETMTYQVGWALKHEPAGWRVSGLILDEQPEPRVFNFESRDDVLAIKQMQDAVDETPADVPRTAENPNFTMPPLN